MSAQPALAPKRRIQTLPTAPQRGLRVVSEFARRRKPKLSYALVAVAGAAAIGLTQLGLSLVITNDAFALSEMTGQQRELSLQTQALQEELDGMGSPQQLASAAADLGLVVGGTPAFLSLSSGAVSGPAESRWVPSSIDPNGPGAVANALLESEAILAPVADATTVTVDGVPIAPAAPPTITEGLPSPITH